LAGGQKLVEIGARIVRHGHYVVFQTAVGSIFDRPAR
jgi:hypothetical protein